MKRIFYYLAFCLLFISRQASGQQIIDLSTGIINGSGYENATTPVKIPVTNNDDTWEIAYAGTTPPHKFTYNI